MSQLTIRTAEIDDAATILHFVRELAIYEKAESEVIATESTVKATMFNENFGVHGLICEYQGQAIGFCVYFYNYSTWLAKPGLYLEDLYVSPEHRGIGAGVSLLRRLANIALDKGCGRFEWSCLDWNKPSRDFYQALGAKSQDEWVGYRMEGKTLLNFASQ